MMDREKVIKTIDGCINDDGFCNKCDYDGCVFQHGSFEKDLLADALTILKEQEQMYYTLEHDWRMCRELLKEQDKEIKALRLLVEWAEDCDFGFDQFHDEYERYKDEIKDMKYIDGMIHVAKRTLEDHGAFEEGSVKLE
jgi:hypothetical protein